MWCSVRLRLVYHVGNEKAFGSLIKTVWWCLMVFTLHSSPPSCTRNISRYPVNETCGSITTENMDHEPGPPHHLPSKISIPNTYSEIGWSSIFPWHLRHLTFNLRLVSGKKLLAPTGYPWVFSGQGTWHINQELPTSKGAFLVKLWRLQYVTSLTFSGFRCIGGIQNWGISCRVAFFDLLPVSRRVRSWGDHKNH